MGFFDTVLEENTKAVNSTTTKKDEQYGSFLIIDDNVNVENIPDTAVQIFDANDRNPVEDTKETTSTSEVSFFSEPSVHVEVSEVSEISSVEPIETEENTEEKGFIEEISVNEPEITMDSLLTETPEVVVDTSFLTEESVIETEIIPEKITVAITEEIMESTQKTETTTLKKIDFDTYIAEKSAELDQFITSNIRLAEIKDEEIVSYNTQIAEAKETEKKAIEMAKKIAKQAIDKAKESAKQALDERKNIELENDRIKEIKARLSIQA